jgi:hypothetical protein
MRYNSDLKFIALGRRVTCVNFSSLAITSVKFVDKDNVIETRKKRNSTLQRMTET